VDADRLLPHGLLLIVDESHIRSRRCTACTRTTAPARRSWSTSGSACRQRLDNRPLTFEEWEDHLNQVIYMSATPRPYESERAEARRRSSSSGPLASSIR
jgi:excinuclease ABC subunit B